MMLLPKILFALIAGRQMGSLVPSTYCSPQCPGCKQDILEFDGNVTSCQPNSTFIVNCGTCYTCVMSHAYFNGGIEEYTEVEDALALVVNMCADASNPEAQEQIEEFSSQAIAISSLGISIESMTASSPATTSATASATKDWTTWLSAKPTTAATVTGTMPPATTSWSHDNSDWTTILSTATWASRYWSNQSIKSALAASAANNVTAITTPTSTARPMTESNQPAPPLSQNWIAGPIVGSILGMSTVFVVIYFTRMKRQQTRLTEEALGKDFPDNESENSEQGKAQLHSECVPVRELENTEVQPPVELPAVEPVGNELLTPRSGTMDPHEEWPLPLSPVPLLFAQAELRDERTGRSESPKHETFYHK